MDCYEGAKMKKEFVMRGQTGSGGTETLNFSGYTPGYAYQIIEFKLYPSTLDTDFECCGAITAGDTAIDPLSPNFNDAAVIATAFMGTSASQPYPVKIEFVLNDDFYITQDLFLSVTDTAASPSPINWQCKFRKVKFSGAAEAVANFNQFTIFDG